MQTISSFEYSFLNEMLSFEASLYAFDVNFFLND